MPVDAELGAVGEVGTELDEEGSEVLVDAIEVVEIDHRARINDPRIIGLADVSALGAGHPRLFLRDPDEDDSLLLGETAQPLLHDVVLALALFKVNHLDALLLGKMLDPGHKALGHFGHLLGRGEAETEMLANEPRHAARAGQLRDIGVEIHPIDAFEFHDDFLLLEFGDILRHLHSGVRLSFCTPRWSNRRLTAIFRRLRMPRRSTGRPLLPSKEPLNAEQLPFWQGLRPGAHARLPRYNMASLQV